MDEKNIFYLDQKSAKPRKVKRPSGPAPDPVVETQQIKKRRDRMVRNFVKTRGRASLRRFIDLCDQGYSGQKIADEFGVTRQRVQQWRDAFGRTIHAYSVHTDILRLTEVTNKGEE